MLNNRIQSVKPPVSGHPKCEDLVVAYRRWSFTRGFNSVSTVAVAVVIWSLMGVGRLRSHMEVPLFEIRFKS